jgi:hypothetical protein
VASAYIIAADSVAEVSGPAHQVYGSDFVSPALSIVDRLKRRQDSVWIFSAKHGLVVPDQVVAAHRQRWATMNSARRIRAAKEAAQLLKSQDGLSRVEVWGGDSVLEVFEPPLRRIGLRIDAPFRGFSTWDWLRWMQNEERNEVSNGVPDT